MDSEQYHTVLALTRLYILQEYAQDAHLQVERDTYDYFKKNYTKPVQQPIQAQTVAKPVPKPVATVPPPIPKKIQPATPPPPPPAPPVATPVAHPQGYLLQALNRALQHAAHVPSGALLDLLKQEKIYVEPELVNSVAPEWKEYYPECFVISFQATKEPFIEKMCEAIETRLMAKTAYVEASLQACASLITFAACGALRSAILVQDQFDAAKINDWLYPITDLDKGEEHVGPLTAVGRLYNVPIYTLKVTQEPSQEEKGALWKALQQVMQRH